MTEKQINLVDNSGAVLPQPLADNGDGTFSIVLRSANDAKASDNRHIDIDSLPKTFSYNTDGTVNYAEVVESGITYRQTFTYTAGKITAISGWVKQ